LINVEKIGNQEEQNSGTMITCLFRKKSSKEHMRFVDQVLFIESCYSILVYLSVFSFTKSQ